MAKAVQFSRAGSDNFYMASRKEGANVSFQFAAFPRTLSPALPSISPPISEEAARGTQHFLSLLLYEEREWSPLRRQEHSLGVPARRGLRWAPAPRTRGDVRAVRAAC